MISPSALVRPPSSRSATTLYGPPRFVRVLSGGGVPEGGAPYAGSGTTRTLSACARVAARARDRCRGHEHLARSARAGSAPSASARTRERAGSQRSRSPAPTAAIASPTTNSDPQASASSSGPRDAERPRTPSATLAGVDDGHAGPCARARRARTSVGRGAHAATVRGDREHAAPRARERSEHRVGVLVRRHSPSTSAPGASPSTSRHAARSARAPSRVVRAVPEQARLRGRRPRSAPASARCARPSASASSRRASGLAAARRPRTRARRSRTWWRPSEREPQRAPRPRPRTIEREVAAACGRARGSCARGRRRRVARAARRPRAPAPRSPRARRTPAARPRTGTPGLRMPAFSRRDRLERVAEHLRVVEPDRRDDGERGRDDVRRVEPAAEPGLEHGRRRRLASANASAPSANVASKNVRPGLAGTRSRARGQARRTPSGCGAAAVDADALAEVDQVGRGEEPGAHARGAQHALDQRRRSSPCRSCRRRGSSGTRAPGGRGPSSSARVPSRPNGPLLPRSSPYSRSSASLVGDRAARSRTACRARPSGSGPVDGVCRGRGRKPSVDCQKMPSSATDRLAHLLAVDDASTIPCSSTNSERWKPGGSSSPIVSWITRGPANPISAPGSARMTSPSDA